jgi:hypothetical protein
MAQQPERFDPTIYADFFAANAEAMRAISKVDGARRALPDGRLPVDRVYRHVVTDADVIRFENSTLIRPMPPAKIGQIAFSLHLSVPRTIPGHNIVTLAPIYPDLSGDESFPLVPIPIQLHVGIGQAALERVTVIPFTQAEDEVRQAVRTGQPQRMFYPTL